MRVISGARRRRVAALLLTTFGQVGAFAGALPFYHLDLRIDPPSGSLEVEAQVTLGPQRAGQSVEFLLARPFVILESSPAVEALPFDAQQGFHGINGSSTALAARGEIIRYRVRLAPGEREIRLRYRGQVDFPPDTRTEEYTRGFRETPGLISKEGIYLGGSTLWYPYFDEELLSFELTGEVPQGWHLISQGSGTSRDAQGRAAWRSEGPVDEIDLVGGPLTLYSQPAGAIQAQVFLRTPEEPLARRYLAATAQYLEMYRGLIGPYPYGKFALVENFWETGYGMPSFTLLGSRIIRFPFILTSSYPHEILHNWWGNSVFVDYASGNWCEGLTAYLADHLLKEQAGQGLEFRRDALRKYRDFVKDDRDFPLTAFRTRHSAATEAVGYGKTLMLFHMLRRELGDETFRAALTRFYREQRGRRASFADLRAVFEKTSGRELGAFFGQWVARTGAPRLALEDLRVEPTGARYRLRGRLVQQQAGAPYVLRVPVYVTTAEGLHIEQISVRSRQADFVIDGLPEPLLVEVDPEFDLFRLLDARETAPSIGQIFGETEILAVLPSRASAESQAAYRRMLEGWRSASHRIEIVSDAALGQLPAGRSVWLLGRENLLAAPLFGTDRSAAVSLSDDSAVVVVRHPTETTKAVGWILIDPPGAAEALARKLPHYGKYSYLGFAGTRSTEHREGRVGGHGFAVARRSAAGRCTCQTRGGGCPPEAGATRRIASGLFRRCAARSRHVARRAGARRPRCRHGRARCGGRLPCTTVRGCGARTGRCRRVVLSALPAGGRPRRRARRPAQCDRCAVSAGRPGRGRQGDRVFCRRRADHGPLRPSRFRLAASARGRSRQASPRRRRQCERRCRAARARKDLCCGRRTGAAPGFSRHHCRGGRTLRCAPLSRGADALSAGAAARSRESRYRWASRCAGDPGARHGQCARVAAPLSRCRLCDGHRRENHCRCRGIFGPAGFHRAWHPGRAALRGRPPGLPPPGRHPRPDRCRRYGEGGDRHEGSRRLPSRARRAAHGDARAGRDG
ncbi:MAG: hypothetical protein IPI06_11900 [Gammaproteobacteria bacterium]|nr:hypothetical protein [Gammaproteobacteria bacterium]